MAGTPPPRPRKDLYKGGEVTNPWENAMLELDQIWLLVSPFPPSCWAVAMPAEAALAAGLMGQARALACSLSSGRPCYSIA